MTLNKTALHGHHQFIESAIHNRFVESVTIIYSYIVLVQSTTTTTTSDVLLPGGFGVSLLRMLSK